MREELKRQVAAHGSKEDVEKLAASPDELLLLYGISVEVGDEIVGAEVEATAATTESRLVECSYCGRTVETFNDAERGQIMFGHRAPLTGITSTPRSEWPWCVGGGRNV